LPEELPREAFDEKGQVKSEYYTSEPFAAYPENHSIWDKLQVPSGSWTLQQFSDWLMERHKLQLKNWAFVLGWKRTEDEEGKEMRVPLSAQIFPPPFAIDAKLLPPLQDAPGDAMKQIQANPAILPAHKMKVLSEWQKAKQTGAMPKPSADTIKSDMRLRDILALMEKKADEAMQDRTLNPKWGKAISGLAGRKFWVIPADQTPSCSLLSQGGEPVDVRYMARLEIPLMTG